MLIVRNRIVIHMQEASFIVPESTDVKWLKLDRNVRQYNIRLGNPS